MTRLKVEVNIFTSEPVSELNEFLRAIPQEDYTMEWIKKYMGMGDTAVWIEVDFKNDADAAAFKLKFDCV